MPPVVISQAPPAAAAPEIVIPTQPAPQITVKVPEVKIPPITIPPAQPAIPTYMLWFIIGIGAVLVIAVIILIIRTRRVV